MKFLFLLIFLLSSNAYGLDEDIPFNFISINTHYPSYKYIHVDEFDRAVVKQRCNKKMLTTFQLPDGSFKKYTQELLNINFFNLPIYSGIQIKTAADGNKLMSVRKCDHCSMVSVNFKYIRQQHSVKIQVIDQNNEVIKQQYNVASSILSSIIAKADEYCASKS